MSRQATPAPRAHAAAPRGIKIPISISDGSKENPFGRMVIEPELDSSKPPLLCGGLPRFVETHGGEYFLPASLTALRMIGDGIVDPT